MTDSKHTPKRTPGRAPSSKAAGGRDETRSRDGGKAPGPRRTYDGARGDRETAPPRGRNERREGPEKPRGPGGATGALIDLDRELMKLLVRRATLVSRIREGREHASSAAAIQAEKAVRVAWETGALSFSKDPLFSRQLFSLLQEIKVLGKEEAEQSGSFTLRPQRGPVSGTITGPTSARTAQMRLVLSACLGRKLRLEPLMLSSALMDTAKACEQAGVVLSWTSDAPSRSRLSLEAGPGLTMADKSLFLGDDPFNAYLMLFCCLGRTGVCRLNGGAALKSLDLSPLRHTLPLFGARLAHVVPNSCGLPATIECSGAIPPHVLLPAELPEEALSALLLAPLVWNVPVTLDLSALPAAAVTAALAEILPLHKDSGADVDVHGTRLTFNPAPLTPPESPCLPLDPSLAAYLLAIPAFTGGSLTMRGIWPADMPEATQACQLFTWSGLSFSLSEDSVTVQRSDPNDRGINASMRPFDLPMQCDAIAPGLGPLFLALSALCLRSKDAIPPLHRLLAYPDSEMDLALATEFFERLGLRYDNDQLSLAKSDPAALPEVPSWTSPGPYWSLAYALGAFLRPGLQLANPSAVSGRMPIFWAVYNSLPQADDSGGAKKQKKEAESGGTTRRRIIAD